MLKNAPPQETSKLQKKKQKYFAYPNHLSGWRGGILTSKDPSNHILS